MVRFPLKLPLLRGLRWSVIGREPAGYAVQFDAQGSDSGKPVVIYDRVVLSAEQLAAWTGWEEPK